MLDIRHDIGGGHVGEPADSQSVRGSVQEAQDRDDSAKDRECLSQHRTGKTPRQASLEGGQIRTMDFTLMIEVGASGLFAAVVGSGVLSDIDHSDGKCLIGAGGGQHPHGRVCVHRGQIITV